MDTVDLPRGGGVLAAWRDWLLEGRWPCGMDRILPPQLPSWNGGEPPRMTERLLAEPGLVDWLFPADRYADASAPGRSPPPLTTGQVMDLLDGGQPLGLDPQLRRFYVDFLSTLQACVDRHGWVRALRSPEADGASLPGLSPARVRAVARVLRFLHLAGWRGYSRTIDRDPFDFRYDAGLHAWLRENWTRQCRGGLSSGSSGPLPACTFPPLWAEALCRLPDDSGRWQESVHCLAGDFNFPRLVQFQDESTQRPGDLEDIVGDRL